MSTRGQVESALRELIRAEVVREGRAGPDPTLDAWVEQARQRYDEARGLSRGDATR